MLGSLISVLVLLGATAARADEAAAAAAAYADLIGRYWYGDATHGHFVREPVSPESVPEDGLAPRCKGCLWEYGVAVGAVYAHWKANGSEDAAARLNAQWAWTKANWSLGDVSACGVGTTNTAQDDTTWDAGSFMQLWEVSHDPTALAYVKGALDCAWNRWHDTATGGGLYYDDKRVDKGSYQAPYAYVSLAYAMATGDPVYRERAVALDGWAARMLQRPDGIYWATIDAPSGAPQGVDRPNDIQLAGSVSFLAGNMAWAALDARLFALTGTVSYKDRAITTARGIRARQTLPGGILMDDRDAWTNGWAAWPYVSDVLPLLPGDGTADGATILKTAIAVSSQDRASDGTYGGDWQGPPDGAWNAVGSTRHQLRTTATAVVWPIVAPYVARSMR